MRMNLDLGNKDKIIFSNKTIIIIVIIILIHNMYIIKHSKCLTLLLWSSKHSLVSFWYGMESKLNKQINNKNNETPAFTKQEICIPPNSTSLPMLKISVITRQCFPSTTENWNWTISWLQNNFTNFSFSSKRKKKY